jgi:hypothetical protein
MSGTSALLADHVASLLPKTTAGACVPRSSWISQGWSCGPTWCCYYQNNCHYSCHGATVCTGWTFEGCT